ncbi:DoxX family protein [Trichodesmium erythraeum 21-75]|nr:DoxX family protein [Trichodesmium erythraeum 21-75]
MTDSTSNITNKKPLNFLSLIFASNQDSNLIFQIGWTLLRVISGVIMIHNGFDKLADVEGFASHVVSETLGFPFPTFLTYCAAYTQIVGAILLILGLLTRPAAIALLSVMMVAIYFHLREDGFVVSSFETASLYATMYLFCFLMAVVHFLLTASLPKK